MTADEVIKEVAELCRSFGAKKMIIYGSRVMGNARECSDIDIAVAGVEDFDLLQEKVDALQVRIKTGDPKIGSPVMLYDEVVSYPLCLFLWITMIVAPVAAAVIRRISRSRCVLSPVLEPFDLALSAEPLSIDP